MKASKYNIFVECNNITICYNSYKDAILVIKKNIYEDFLHLNLQDFSSAHKSTYETFIEHGFLVPKEKNELDIIRMEHKQAIADNHYLQLTIYPTQDCNLKCWYCYETHIKNSRMTENIQNNIIQFVKNYTHNNKLKNLNITFFGGEPLLSFNNIAYPLALSLKTFCESNKINYTTFFITNGSLINENMIEKFNNINATFQITLDGCREKHNQVRIGKVNSFKTYDHIINALYLLSHNLKAYPSILAPITLRINYDNETLKNSHKILEDIEKFNKNSVFIHFERVWQTQNQINREQIELLIKIMRMFTQKGFHCGVGTFGNKRYSCPAEKLNYAVINYNGFVYRCNGRNLTDKTKEGFLNDKGIIEWNQNYLASRLGPTTFENEMCLNCKMLPQCMGPCSQKCIEHNWKDLKEVCALKSIDMSLDEYIMLRCEMDWILKKHIV